MDYSFTTDVHAHVFPLGLPRSAASGGDVGWPRLDVDDGVGTIYRGDAVYRRVGPPYWDADQRIEWMATRGISRQVVSPLPVLLSPGAPPLVARDLVHQLNEAVARFVDRDPARLLGFGAVPLQDPDLAIAELDHIEALGLAGLEIGTVNGDRELDDPSITRFLRAAAERGLPVLLHPLEGVGLRSMDDVLVRFGVGVPADTALALAVLLLGGALAEVTDLRLCVCHGGGSFLWSLPRLLPMVRQHLGTKAEEQLVASIRRLYVDTASLGPENLDYLLRFVPESQLLLGSDYPATEARSPFDAFGSVPDEALQHMAAVTNPARFLTGSDSGSGSPAVR